MKRQIVRDHLRVARKKLGLSALGLAVKTGTSEHYIFAVERGRTTPSGDKAQLIADALGMSLCAAFPELSGEVAQ